MKLERENEMKKFMLLSMLFGLFLSSTFPALASSPITVMVDNNQLSFTQQTPVVKDGRAFVPVRAIFEALDATISWDDGTKTIIAFRGTDQIQMTVQNR